MRRVAVTGVATVRALGRPSAPAGARRLRPAEPRHLSEAAQACVAAARDAVSDAGLGRGGPDPYDRGLVLAISAPTLGWDAETPPRRPPGDVLLADPNVGVAAVARAVGWRGPLVSLRESENAIGVAVAEALWWVQDAACSAFLAGVVPDGAAPYPARAAVMVVVEDTDSAVARGARIHAELPSGAAALDTASWLLPIIGSARGHEAAA